MTSSPFTNEIMVANPLKEQKQTKHVIFENVDVKSKPPPQKYKVTESQKRCNSVVSVDVDLEKSNNVDTKATSSKKYISTRGRNKIKRVNLDNDEDFDDPYVNEDAEDYDPACIYCNELFSPFRPKIIG